MREQSEFGETGNSGLTVPETALKLAPNITAAEALAVFQRKLPGAEAEVREVLHPFWWTVLSARTRGIFGRSQKSATFSTPGQSVAEAATKGPAVAEPSAAKTSRGQRMNVLVNAYSGKGFIADFEPSGKAVAVDEWIDAYESSDQAGPQPSVDQVRRTARSLVRTKVVKTVKLGMGISIDEVAVPSGVLKPNWVLTGANDKFSATILVDGLDSSHYIVRVEKL